MRKSLHSEEKIVGILKEHEAGAPVADLCRRHEMRPAGAEWSLAYRLWCHNNGVR